MDGRAELKVEGGKLLRADVTFDETIQDVELHGDFFVYPEEALDTLEAALEGVETGAGQERLSELVEHSLDADTRLVGFAPDNVAAVVMEAVQDEE
ncbi:MAG: biotin--protein ligase [Candidatus Nanohaloarchaea archaeon]|nr:biotin--protein ligase [Candidatus Nanohaloarchaea archaeon]